ncbi:hypothetical protein [Nonomuraea glycinis]|jgi:hypothetical protein|uniref:hypothetical protein n=1 Tax=Nonomuraea glycinis TaxID=2047744 RepID=UPI002E115E47|nr:hypothetical protein OHA68_39330 [Nonomuraea glycinis]
MIRRLFYMSLGAFLAVWVMRRLQALHPAHVARRTVGGAADMLTQVRDFTSDALGEAAGRETELRAHFGLGNAETND